MRQVKIQARILIVGEGFVLLASTVRIVSVSLHPIRQLSPRRVEIEQRGVIDEIIATANAQLQIVNGLAHVVHQSAMP